MKAQTQELLASVARTTSGESASFPLSTATMLFVGVDLTAISGTSPELTVFLQASDDGGTTWFDVPSDWHLTTTATATTTTAATYKRNIVDEATAVEQTAAVYRHFPADRLRVKWILAGTTPSATFSVSMVSK